VSLEKKVDVFGMSYVVNPVLLRVGWLVGWLVGADVSTVTMRDNENSRKRIKQRFTKITLSKIKNPMAMAADPLAMRSRAKVCGCLVADRRIRIPLRAWMLSGP
jgi:hypothetical protein